MAEELTVAHPIEVRDELLISGFLRALNRSSFDIAPLIYNLCILYRLGSAQHLWTIDQATLQQMKHCAIGQHIESPTFEIEGLIWQFVIYPKGYNGKNRGSCDLFIKLVHIPSDWKHIEFCSRIQCLETLTEYVMYKELAKGEMWGWPKNSMLFSEIGPLNFLSFSINFTIQRIVLKENDRVFFERDNVATNQCVEWKIDRERMQILKTGLQEKILWANLYGGMYYLGVKRTDVGMKCGLKVRGLPRGKTDIQLLWTIEIIAEGDDFKKLKKMDKFSKTFKRGELEQAGGSGVIPFSFEQMQFIMQCDSLIFKVNIKCDSIPDNKGDQLTIDYWTKLRMKQDGDEEKESAVKSNDISSLHERVDTLESAVESQSARLITMISKMEQDMAAMNQRLRKLEADRVIDAQSSNEDTERMKFKKWMENKVKLPQYFELFIEQGFEDMENMKDITMEHLREMGIDKMGHRMKLMKSIAALKAADE